MPQRYDPLAFHYFTRLEAHLRRSDPSQAVRELHLVEDLLVRSRAAAQHSQSADNSEAITKKRVTWCVYRAAALFLTYFGMQAHATTQRELTFSWLDAVDGALRVIAENTHVEAAEHAMGDSGDNKMRSTGQIWLGQLKQRTRELALLQEMTGYARLYLQGTPAAAGSVGGTFFDFLVVHGETRDALVTWTEELVRVV